MMTDTLIKTIENVNPNFFSIPSDRISTKYLIRHNFLNKYDKQINIGVKDRTILVLTTGNQPDTIFE